MSRFRIVAALCISAGVVLTVSSRDEYHVADDGEELTATPQLALEPAPEPRPSALLARFGDAQVKHPADRFEFSADGKRMLAVGAGSAQTWELPNGRMLASFPIVPEGQFSGPSRVALSPDGRWAVTSSPFDMRTVVRDAETGMILSDKQWSEDKLLAGLDGPSRVWVRNHTTGDLVSHALPSGPTVRTIPTPAKYAGFFTSPDGRWLVTSSGRDALRLRDGRAAEPGWVELESYRDQPMGACGRVPPACAIPVRFSPDGRFLLTYWRGFNLWHLTGGAPGVVRLTAVRDHTRWYPDASFSPDGRRLLAVVPDQVAWAEPGYVGSVRVWETASGTEAFTFDPPGGATGCSFTPDGKRLVVAHPDATFSVWDYRALETQSVRSVGDTWNRLVSRDGKAGLSAINALVTNPAAVADLRNRFRPTNPEVVARLIVQLGDDDYATREAAEIVLKALGERAERALLVAFTDSPLPEVRSRAGRLLGPISGPRSAARLRAARAVEALELIGTPAAKELLSEWAAERGPALAPEAKAALKRVVTPR